MAPGQASSSSGSEERILNFRETTSRTIRHRFDYDPIELAAFQSAQSDLGAT